MRRHDFLAPAGAGWICCSNTCVAANVDTNCGCGTVCSAVQYRNSGTCTTTATFIRSWSSAGAGNGSLANPQGVAVAPDGSIYVADTSNSRVLHFNASGTLLAKWGTSGTGDGRFGPRVPLQFRLMAPRFMSLTELTTESSTSMLVAPTLASAGQWRRPRW
ncbi:MAG: hypothetical protein U0031_20645 [Thermomicrobiales bacterium]